MSMKAVTELQVLSEVKGEESGRSGRCGDMLRGRAIPGRRMGTARDDRRMRLATGEPR